MLKNNYLIRNILEIPIWAITRKEIPQQIAYKIESFEKQTFMYVNAHCLNTASHNIEYREILKRASMVYSGGIGPVLASRILGQPLPERSPTPDFIEDVFDIVQRKNWSIYLLGTKEKSLKLFIKKIKQKFPHLNICGFHNGYFNSVDEEKIIKEINFLKPTILIVGMGTPRQEKWVYDNLDKVDAKAFWVVGALFDVMAGALPRAPKWIQNVGLEWLFRFLQEPKRLWKRYLIGNAVFLHSIFLTLLNNFNQEITRVLAKNGRDLILFFKT